MVRCDIVACIVVYCYCSACAAVQVARALIVDMSNGSYRRVLSSFVVLAVLLLIVAIVQRRQLRQVIQRVMNGRYFTVKELCASSTADKLGISNSPGAEEQRNIEQLIEHVLDPAREQLGHYIRVNSGYRCKRLNDAVGGSSSSQHLSGQAADLTTGSIDGNRRLFGVLQQQQRYDQLIWEYGGKWVHVSYDASRRRGEMLSYNGSGYERINSIV